MKKKLVAFIVAFVITGIVAVTMLVVGVSAAFNKNSVAVSNSPTQAQPSTSAVTTSGDPAQQIAQLQSLVAQYQARDQQYQQQLSQAQQEIQSVQQLLTFLQQRGLISIDNQGNIVVHGGFGRDDNGFGG